jgi:hypothetical protein
MLESIAQHPSNAEGNRRLQPANWVLIESWVLAKLITFKPPEDKIIRN